MREFWVASGHHLTTLDVSGRMQVTDALILAWLARPEIIPPPEACAAERALHVRLLKAPQAAVSVMELANMEDPDARENWQFLMTLRDTLLAAGSVEEGYLALVRGRVRLPHLFYDQLVQLILRNALEGCEDVHTLRAAEMLFRPQRAYLNEGALMLADDELVSELEGEIHSNPLFAMLNGGVDQLDVLNGANAWTYWSRSDAHTMVLPFGADPLARAGMASALSRFVSHLMDVPVAVTALQVAEDVDLQWYVGLDQAGTEIGNALWKGEAPDASLAGLFALTFLRPEGVAPQVRTTPVYLLMGLDGSNVIRFKPQNLVTGLPLAELTDALPPAMGRA
ncbi:DUF6352 family protein [Sulfitobacter guttiformis]|uniref:Uncharacterized protein n=1 Tax=Sulfitobacter guttiformis TaxID=74349 RepID=A0A420DJ65_9RHOB|nr:DUF6352 family protein [Sulfitobacter guttiformis]KIN71947.1 hypothetical protein Z949_1113 [Sulfitobacter guttiformis KCTC 32187]RKE94252.1 hypothetical protein C8N30_3370 [Sulfitobacter guttiformis]